VLHASDVGRPVGRIAPNLVSHDSLVADMQTVLKTLTPQETDVQTAGGQFFTRRILPYRTLDNVIEGAVIIFTDISEVMRAREAVHTASALRRQASVVHDATDAITVQDLNGRTIAWNPSAFLQRCKRVIRQDGRVLDMWVTSTALVDAKGLMYAVATTERQQDAIEYNEGKIP